MLFKTLQDTLLFVHNEVGVGSGILPRSRYEDGPESTEMPLSLTPSPCFKVLTSLLDICVEDSA